MTMKKADRYGVILDSPTSLADENRLLSASDFPRERISIPATQIGMGALLLARLFAPIRRPFLSCSYSAGGTASDEAPAPGMMLLYGQWLDRPREDSG